MNTNQASAGGSDDDMRDAPFDNDSTFGGVGDVAAERIAAQDEDIPDLIDIPLPAGIMPPPALPSYENVMEMDTGVSPALAQVSLQDGKSSSPPIGQEMRERPNALLLTRSNNNGGATNGSAVNGAAAAEEELLIDLSDVHDPGFNARVNGV
jgi:hypothetical protein